MTEKSNKIERLNQVVSNLADWINELHFDPSTRLWHVTLKPAGIIITPSLNRLVGAVERHVISELIEISSEVLNIDSAGISQRTRVRELTDLRAVVALLVFDHFPEIRQESINELLGWRNRSSVSLVVRLRDVREVNEKIEKVYRAYPQLRKGRVEITTINKAV